MLSMDPKQEITDVSRRVFDTRPPGRPKVRKEEDYEGFNQAIPYDYGQSPGQRDPNFPKNSCRMLFVGKSGSGKTTKCFHLIQNNIFDSDYIIVQAPSASRQPLYHPIIQSCFATDIPPTDWPGPPLRDNDGEPLMSKWYIFQDIYPINDLKDMIKEREEYEKEKAKQQQSGSEVLDYIVRASEEKAVEKKNRNPKPTVKQSLKNYKNRKQPRVLVVIDDVTHKLGSSSFSNMLVDYFTATRSMNWDIIFLAHGFFNMDPTLRKNTDCYFLFNGCQDGRHSLQALHGACGSHLFLPKFKELIYDYITDKDHGMLYIAKDKHPLECIRSGVGCDTGIDCLDGLDEPDHIIHRIMKKRGMTEQEMEEVWQKREYYKDPKKFIRAKRKRANPKDNENDDESENSKKSRSHTATTS